MAKAPVRKHRGLNHYKLYSQPQRMTNSRQDDNELSSPNTGEDFNSYDDYAEDEPVVDLSQTTGFLADFLNKGGSTPVIDLDDDDLYTIPMKDGIHARDALSTDIKTNHSGIPILYFTKNRDGYDENCIKVYDSRALDNFIDDILTIKIDTFEVKIGVDQEIAESLPTTLPKPVMNFWEDYMSGTKGYQAASTCLAAGTLQSSFPIVTVNSGKNLSDSAFQPIVTGGSGSGKSRTLKPFLHMQNSIVATLEYQDELCRKIIHSWNAFIVELNTVIDGDDIDKAAKKAVSDIIAKSNYDQIRLSAKQFKLHELGSKSIKEIPQYYTPNFMPSGATGEKLTKDAISHSNMTLNIRQLIYLAKKIIDGVKAGTHSFASLDQVGIDIAKLEQMKRPIVVNSPYGIQMDEINSYLMSEVSSGMASQTCARSQRADHGYKAKGDIQDSMGGRKRTEYHVAMSGCTTDRNMRKLLATYEDVVISGLSGRLSFINVVRPSAAVGSGDSTSELTLYYWYAVAGIMATAFPKRYSIGQVKASSAQTERLMMAIRESQTEYQNYQIEPSINRFVENQNALAAQTVFYHTLMNDVERWMPAIQKFNTINQTTGELYDLSLAHYLGSDIKFHWWKDTQAVAGFLDMMLAEMGPEADVCLIDGSIPDSIWDDATNTIRGSIRSLSATFDAIDAEKPVLNNNRYRAEQSMRRDGDEDQKQRDASEVIRLISEVIGSTPEMTARDVGKKLRTKTVAKSLFSQYSDTTSAKLAASDSGIKSLIKKMVEKGIIIETPVHSKRPKATLSIGRVLTDSERWETAKTIIE